MPTFDDAAPNALRQEDVVDEYPGGNKVADPYRWLEDPDGADTVKWVEAQCKTTNAYLGTLEAREFLKERLTEKYNYAKTGSTFVRGKDGMRRYYFYKNDGLQNQYVMFSSATVDGDPELFFDPNKLASDGTKALGATAFAKSGKMWAYGVSASGSDWQTIYLRDIATKEDMKDSDGNVEKCEWVKFSGIAWLHDDSGFFYSRYPAPAALADDKVEGDDVKRGSETNANTGMMVYFHKVGTPQAEDKKIFAIPEEPKHMPRAEVTDDGEYVIITVSESTAPTNKVYWAKVSDVAAASGHDPVPVTKMIDNFDAGFDYITNEGTLFYFQTNKDAPRYKLITIDIARPTEHQDILPHHASNVLSTVVCTGEKYLVATYMQDAQQTLTIYDMSGGEVCKVALPDVGTVGSLSGRKVDMEFFYSFTGFVTPGQKFRFDLEKMEALKIREDTVTDHNPDDFETKQVFFESSDGTKVRFWSLCCFSKRGERESVGERKRDMLRAASSCLAPLVPKAAATAAGQHDHVRGRSCGGAGDAALCRARCPCSSSGAEDRNTRVTRAHSCMATVALASASHQPSTRSAPSS
jgi:prolyl oligopeptidase